MTRDANITPSKHENTQDLNYQERKADHAEICYLHFACFVAVQSKWKRIRQFCRRCSRRRPGYYSNQPRTQGLSLGDVISFVSLLPGKSQTVLNRFQTFTSSPKHKRIKRGGSEESDRIHGGKSLQIVPVIGN